MDDWIDINDRLPTEPKLQRYNVKMQVGSMTTKEVESVIMGKMTGTGFRFIAGDWQRVTHWRELKANSC